jgi:hypothetical protein
MRTASPYAFKYGSSSMTMLMAYQRPSGPEPGQCDLLALTDDRGAVAHRRLRK